MLYTTHWSQELGQPPADINLLNILTTFTHRGNHFYRGQQRGIRILSGQLHDNEKFS